MSKFCYNCGKELPDDAVFCDNCGASMSQPGPQAMPPQPQTQPMPQYQPQAQAIQPQMPQYQQPQYQQPYGQPPQEKTNVGLIIGIIAGAIVLIVGGFFVFKKVAKKDEGQAKATEGKALDDEVAEDGTTGDDGLQGADTDENDDAGKKAPADDPLPTAITDIPAGMNVFSTHGVSLLYPDGFVLNEEPEECSVADPDPNVFDQVQIAYGYCLSKEQHEIALEKNKEPFTEIRNESITEGSSYTLCRFEATLELDGVERSITYIDIHTDREWVVLAYADDGSANVLSTWSDRIAFDPEFNDDRPKLYDFDWTLEDTPPDAKFISELDDIKGYWKVYIDYYDADKKVALMTGRIVELSDATGLALYPYQLWDGESAPEDDDSMEGIEYKGTFDSGWLFLDEGPGILECSVMYESQGQQYITGDIDFPDGTGAMIAFVRPKSQL